MVRLPGVYGASAGLHTTPSRPGTLEQVEPLACDGRVVGDRRQVHVGGQVEGLQCFAALREGQLADVLAVVAQYVECHEPGRCRLGQFLDLPAARLRAWSDAVAQ
jgi:hypothetical protein